MVAFLLTTFLIDDGDEARAIHSNEAFGAPFDNLDVHELYEARAARFDLGLLRDAGGRAANVEGTHRELRARFSDGLRADDADGLAEFNHAASGKVASVAASANSAPAFAGEDRT